MQKEDKLMQKLFGRRLGRSDYFFVHLIIEAMVLATLLIIGGRFQALLFIIAALTKLPFTVRRLHDIGLPGYWAIITYGIYLGEIVTFFSVLFFLFLTFKRGTDGENKYGKQPRPETSFLDAILNRGYNKNQILS